LQGESLDDQAISSAADMASGKEINPFGNIHASTEYQRHLANVLTRKALHLAAKRAAEEE
jgi:CO/xanthine dehydrogenase FAD-binding subunit